MTTSSSSPKFAAQHNTSIAQGAPTPLDDSAGLTVPVTPSEQSISPGATCHDQIAAIARSMRVRVSGTSRRTICAVVLGMRGDFNDWDWEVAAQRARSESEQTGDRSQGLGAHRLPAAAKSTRVATTRSAASQNPQSVIDAITTSLVRRGKSDLTSYDAQITASCSTCRPARCAWRPASSIARRAIKDIPDDQFQRGLIFGTEAVSAAASRDSWAAFVEFAVPVLREPRAEPRRCATTTTATSATRRIRRSRLRWAPIESLAFRASWGTGFRAPSLAQIGLGPSQESQFFKDTFWCAEQGSVRPIARLLDYTIIFSGNPDLERGGIGDASTSALPGSRATSGPMSPRLLGHQAGEQDRRGAVRLPVPAASAPPRPARSACAARRWRATRWARCRRSAPRSSTSVSRRRNGVDLSGYYRFDLGRRRR